MIKKTNPAIQKKLLGLKPPKTLHDLLMTLGYINMDEEHYVFIGDYFVVLLLGQGILEHQTNRLKIKYMPEEERKRLQLVEQKRLEAIEESKNKQDYIKKLQEQSECDRKEKALQKAKASVANELKFGANVKKFEPPNPPQGG